MYRKKLEELNLIDDFLFTTLLTYPELGNIFTRKVLGIIFDRDFGRLKIHPQKIYPGLNTNLHGSRLDVYIEDEDGIPDAEIFDMEPDKNDAPSDIEGLPRRMRFYHAMIDIRSLKSGLDYRYLKNVTIITITTYDPFGRDRMVYTIQNMCKEVPELPYDDGAKTLFLYINGKEGNPPQKLKEFLRYMGDTRPENAVNDTLKEIQKMVDIVKDDKEVSLSYMKVFEQEQRIREQGRAEEKVNTEREKIRADIAEQKLDVLSKLFKAKTNHPEWTFLQLASAAGCTVADLEQILR